jgi:uncharacterized oligopeptide transporter (OPT) family protein
MGFLVPASYAAALCAGGLAAAALRAARPAAADRLVPVLGAGAISGESLAGLTLAVLAAAGVLG